jgi:hypothetical protein
MQRSKRLQIVSLRKKIQSAIPLITSKDLVDVNASRSLACDS